MAETVILVDGRNRALGAAEKLDAHRRGLLHRAFSVFLTRPDGRFLLQRRSLEKYHSGGVWANSCCGHPRPGERTAAAARRRVGEELRLQCEPALQFTTRYTGPLDGGMTENEIVLVYSAPLSGDPAPDPGEVSELAFRSLDEIKEDIVRTPERVAIWLRHYVSEHEPELRAMTLTAAVSAG